MEGPSPTSASLLSPGQHGGDDLAMVKSAHLAVAPEESRRQCAQHLGHGAQRRQSAQQPHKPWLIDLADHGAAALDRPIAGLRLEGNDRYGSCCPDARQGLRELGLEVSANSALKRDEVLRLAPDDGKSLRGLKTSVGRITKSHGLKIESWDDGAALYLRRADK